MSGNKAVVRVTRHVNEVIAIYPITFPHLEKNGRIKPPDNCTFRRLNIK
ncbi:hypothetical protein [cyanobacterium endosymbiont of Epithemia turgida]|nr:hypothetical protein [cyanobacterium endosymbiont of Epithemia turgida]